MVRRGRGRLSLAAQLQKFFGSFTKKNNRAHKGCPLVTSHTIVNFE